MALPSTVCYHYTLASLHMPLSVAPMGENTRSLSCHTAPGEAPSETVSAPLLGTLPTVKMQTCHSRALMASHDTVSRCVVSVVIPRLMCVPFCCALT